MSKISHCYFDSNFTQFTLQKLTSSSSDHTCFTLKPILPQIGFMFVHWTAHVGQRQDFIYEVPHGVKDCMYCAYHWRLFGDGCFEHRDPEPERDVVYPQPIKYDYKQICRLFDDLPFLGELLSVPESHHPYGNLYHDLSAQPRRSKRQRKQTQFYIGC